MITVLTPTYNRVELLKRLFYSLMSQSSFNFEWLVIDDGSSDKSKGFITSVKSISPFPIHYVYKENGGKHTALNVGFLKAQKEWIFIVDSDDWLEINCIEEVLSYIEKPKIDFHSISMLKKESSGKVIGDKFLPKINNYIDRIEKDIVGDKADVFKKSALNEFSFPEFKNENFMAESPLFLWFGSRYNTKFINYAGYICEYQEQGLSSNSIKNRHRCFRSSLYVYKIQYSFLKSRSKKYKAAINYFRFYIGKNTVRDKEIPLYFYFFGWCLSIRDHFNKHV